MAKRKQLETEFNPSIRDSIGITEPLVKLKPEYRNLPSYSVKLKDPRWQKRRLEIMQRDSFKCRVCEDDKTTLAIHHHKYSGEPWDAPDEDLITVCEDCHKQIELLKKAIIEDGGVFDFYNMKIFKKKYGDQMFLIIKDSKRYILKNYNENNDASFHVELLKKSRSEVIAFLNS